MVETNPKVDQYLGQLSRWKEESARLRSIALDCELNEELKWRQPCYTFEKHNIVIIQGFNDFCALMFFKGVLLKDPKGILIKFGENTQSARRIEFTSVAEVDRLEATLKAYINEAIEVERAGLKVEFRQDTQPIPKEFQERLDKLPALKTAFEALTPGRQRAYIMHFATPKQSKTREARVEQAIPKILDGVGLNDR